MATTALSSTTSAALASSPEAVAAANKANAQKLITSMGAGSGVDVASLAQNLVNAEKLPKEQGINTKIAKNEARISGYSALAFVLNGVKTAMTDLKDQNSFNAVTATNSNTSAFSITTNASAAEGSHSVEVQQIAKPQRDISNGFSSPLVHLNGNAPMALSFSVGPTSAITPTKVTTATVPPQTETSTVQFKDLLGSESVTVAGLTFIAAADMSAADVAAVFAGLSADPATPISPSSGVFVGNLDGFNASASSSGDSLVFTSISSGANVPDIDVQTDAATSPAVTTVQGDPGALGYNSVTFKDLKQGQSVTLAGLTFTASAAMTGTQVAAAFAGLTADVNTPANPATGTFAGHLSGFNVQADQGIATLRFTVASDAVAPQSMTISADTARIQLAAGKDTPQDVVDAINASSAGVTAQLVNTGDGLSPYQVVLTGPLGTAGGFTLSTSYGAGSGSPGLNFGFNLSNQSAADALVKVDGVTFSRPPNTLTDVVPGVTLNLKATTSSAANLDLTRDNTAIKDKITALVSAYNDAVTIFNEVSDPKSSLATYGATLVGDSTVRLVKTQLRSMMTGPSSTPSGSVAALWQLGVSIDQTGAMSVDNTKLDAALTNNYDDVVKAFTGNQNGLSIYSPAPAGIAGDMVKKLTTMLGKTGMLVSQSNSATAQNTKYKDNLTKLNTRMDALLVRYQKQFASMDSLVGNVNSQKTSLKSTFDGMMASLTGKNG